MKYSIIETFFFLAAPIKLLKEKARKWADSEKDRRREGEGREMFQKEMKKKLIPAVYSTHITPSYLGLYSGFRKKVEGVRGGTQRTKIKMGSDGGKEGGGQAASG